jgi:Uri superfamily endonuclease
MPSTYQLHIHLREAVRITVGRLGAFDFPAGRYVYTGSARRGIEARVRRHLAKEKKLRWHIDYLLAHPAARVERVELSERGECELNWTVAGRIVVARFGASDCRSGCGSHLKWLGEREGE